MPLSQNFIIFLAQLEGIRTKPYRDAAGLQTIGVGHLITQQELRTGIIVINADNAEWRGGLSTQQVYDLLDQDLQRFVAAVEDAVNVPLTQNQFEALVSFAFNIGIGAFRSSSLLRKLNSGDYDIENELMRWTRAGGRELQGLVNRRRAEWQWYN